MGRFDNILCKITGSKFRSDVAGKSIEIDSEGFSGDNMRNDMFFPAGIMSRPPDNTYGLFIPFGDSRSNGIIVAMNNYKISIEHNKGEIIIYSTNQNGDEVKAKIKLDNNGNIENVIDGKFAFDNDSEKMKILVDDLIDEIIAIQTQGSPVSHVLTPASIANFNFIKSRFGTLLKEGS